MDLTGVRPPQMSPAKLIVHHVTQGAGTRHRVIMSGMVSRLVLWLIDAHAVFAQARRFLLPPEEAFETLRRHAFTSSGVLRLRSRALPVFVGHRVRHL